MGQKQKHTSKPDLDYDTKKKRRVGFSGIGEFSFSFYSFFV